MRSWRRSAAIVAATAVVVVAAHAGGAGGSHTDPFAFFDRWVVLGDADWQRLDGGEVAVRLLPGTDGHVGVFAASRLDAPAASLVDWVREIEAFKQSGFVMAIRRFSDPPVMRDLEGLTVDAGGPRSDPRLSRRLLRPQATHVDIVQPEAPHAPAVIVLAKEILATHCRTASLGITAVVEDPARGAVPGLR